MRSLKTPLPLALLLLLSFVALARPARAQADWAVYGQGTGANLRFQSTGQIYGGTLGFYGVKQSGALGLGVDARGSMLGGGDAAGAFTDRRMDLGLVGARASYSAHALTPYVETLFGLGYFRGGTGVNRQDQTSAALLGLGGVDLHIRGGFDWRVAEVGYNRLKGQFGSIHPISVSTGVVFHLP